MSRLWEQTHEPFLLEMSVGGEGFAEAAFSHQQKTHGITQGIGFVLTFLQQGKCCPMQIFVNPNNLQQRVLQ